MKKTLGIIAEYNPFHKGHEYHIKESKMLSGADCVVVVMSGNFVQRGEPAIIDKYTRTRMALLNGADLVIELPVASACASAQYFARGSVGILHTLKVDTLSFGSESGSLNNLLPIAQLINDNQKLLDDFIQCAITTGMSYPTARSKGIEHVLSLLGNNDMRDTTADMLKQSNNILGLEYLLEIKRLNSHLMPMTIKRQGSNYNDIELSGTFSSASSIRNKMIMNGFISQDSIPKNAYNILCDYEVNHHFMTLNDFTDVIKYILLELSANSETIKNNSFRNNIADMPEFLLNKLFKSFEKSNSVTELIENVKSKDLTYSRISRGLIHLLLNITYEDYYGLSEGCQYIRVLGLNDTGAQYLSTIKKDVSCPIITKPADYKDLLAKDINASNIYNMVANKFCKKPLSNDYQHPIIKL